MEGQTESVDGKGRGSDSGEENGGERMNGRDSEDKCGKGGVGELVIEEWW